MCVCIYTHTYNKSIRFDGGDGGNITVYKNTVFDTTSQVTINNLKFDELRSYNM